MAGERRKHGIAALAGLTALAASVAPAPAAAHLLDEPPKVLTFELCETGSITLLDAFENAEIERPGPVRSYMGGRWGRWRTEPWLSFSWLGAAPPIEPEPLAGDADAVSLTDLFAPPETDEEALALVKLAADARDLAGETPLFASTGPSLASDGFDRLFAAPPAPVPWWKCRRNKGITFVRYGAEQDTFKLLDCDGAVAPEALDRLTLVARPPGVPSPGRLLPDEPDPDAWARGEWLPSVRPVHPRLLWLLQRIADAFPRRTIYVYSGYRPKKEGAKRGTHNSLHGEARAMDIHVMGVPNSELFKACRKLDDVGCGYYPNSKFVHVDVRRPATGRAFWIDVSGPGEPSRFVDSWPGVVDAGGLAWDARARDRDPQPEPQPAPP